MGGHYWRKVLHTDTGEKENPVLPMGRRKKTLVGHRKLIIESTQASTVGVPLSCKFQWSTHEKLNSDLLKSVNNEIGKYFGEKKKSKRPTRITARVHLRWKEVLGGQPWA